jgi:branched-chain amino acid transport system ATP-binding protein
MLAIGRALMGDPKLLLMDEPSEGLAPVIVEELGRSIAKLRDTTGMAIVLVEQHTRFALGFSTRCVVMDRGQIAFDGPSAELSASPEKLQQLIGVSA